jgi:diguanylate cyclase (GGDEF)-like protein/PAS domain S-box-containing protein
MSTLRSDAADGANFSPKRLRRTILRMLVVALAYYLTARLGLLIPYVGTHVSLVWLPTGIAIAAFTRWGTGMSAAVFVGAMGANAAIGGPLWMAAAVGLGNTLGPWLSSRLLQRWNFDWRLIRRSDLAAFLLAVLLGMLVTSANGTSWLYLAGVLDAAHWPQAWVSWWIGDAVGALLGGVPLVAMNRAALERTFLERGGAGNAGLQAAVLVCGLAAFSPWLQPDSALLFPLVSLPFFLITLLALRAGVISSSLAVLALSVTAAFGTAQGLGPFAGYNNHAGILALWSYVTAQACTSLLVCGVATELQSNRRQLAALVRHAHDGIVMIGPDDALVMVNPAAATMLGLADSPVEAQPLSWLPHGNGELLHGWLAQQAENGSADLSLHKSDGGTLPVECQLARYRDASGNWQTHLMLRDVSVRKDAEAKAAASEQRLQAIADNIPALISHIDADLNVLFANRTFESWIGRPPLSVVGRHVREVFGPAAYETHRLHASEVFRSGHLVSFETEVEVAGSMRFLRTTYVPDCGSDGQVRGIYALSMDITDMKTVEAQLTHQARFDHLTGLPNRQQFEERLHDAILRARGWARPIGLLFIDVDHFKNINDTHGHAAGDAVLVEFGRRLLECVRSSDMVARLAGDEFVVVLEQMHRAEEARIVARKILALMARPIQWNNRAIVVSASIGVGLAESPELATAVTLMATADESLYAAKRAGRNRFECGVCTPGH